MEDLKSVISKNIINLRKSMNWTQAELAQKLNYSDKAVSKWERAESIPDVIVLKEIADLFNIKVDYLLNLEHADADVKDSFQIESKHKKRNRIIVALQSVLLVYLIATIVFVVLKLLSVQMSIPTWMIYIYALPVSCIVLLVFNSIWGKRIINFIIITFLFWSILLAIYLSFLSKNLWLIFTIGFPSQIIILLWANFKLKDK